MIRTNLVNWRSDFNLRATIDIHRRWILIVVLLLAVSCKDRRYAGNIQIKTTRSTFRCFFFFFGPNRSWTCTRFLIASPAAVLQSALILRRLWLEEAWECKLTTAQCWNHRSCGTFYYSSCGPLARLILMEAAPHMSWLRHRFWVLKSDESQSLGYWFGGLGCVGVLTPGCQF